MIVQRGRQNQTTQTGEAEKPASSGDDIDQLKRQVDDLQKRLDRLQAHRVTAAQWGELGAAHRALRIDRRPGRLIVYIGVTLQP
jgi:hypothetical protein